MKKMFSKIIICTCFLIACFFVFNACNSDEKNIKNDGILLYEKGSVIGLTNYGKTLKEIEIPEKYDGMDINNIAEEAFKSCVNLEGIVIPNTITTIGSSAFSGCISLSEVVIPDNLTIINPYTFADCSSLTSIIIPDNVVSIGNNALYGCELLSEIIIGESVQFVGDSAFAYCSLVESIKLPDSLKNLGVYVFYQCANLKSVNFGSGIENITRDQLVGCKLENIIIGEGIKTIEQVAFNNNFYDSLKTLAIKGNNSTVLGRGMASSCILLTDVIIENGIIGNEAFKNCNNLNNLTLGNGVQSIGDSAFIGCRGLTEITITNNVQTIGSYSFAGCSNLLEVNFGSDLINFGSSAFYNCNKLEKVNINSIEVWCSYNFSDYFANPLYYAQHLYLNNEEIVSLIIPQTIAETKKWTFAGAYGIVCVSIPSTITNIDNDTFFVCPNLTTLVIDSPVIANSLTEELFQNYRLGYNVINILIKEGLTISNSTPLTNYYTKIETTNGYDSFVKKD